VDSKDAAYCDSMSHVAWPVCMCVGHMEVPCKTTELIEMPFGGLTRVGQKKHVLDGIKIGRFIRSYEG